MMDREIITVIAEQLKNEFPDYDKDFYLAAKRLYSIMRLEQPSKEIELAREIIKSALKTLD